MLEIIGQILSAMLLFNGIGFIVQAFNRQTDNAAALIVSLVAAAFCIMAAVYFYNQIGNQASGARKAMDDLLGGAEEQRELLRQQSDAPVEPVAPAFRP